MTSLSGLVDVHEGFASLSSFQTLTCLETAFTLASPLEASKDTHMGWTLGSGSDSDFCRFCCFSRRCLSILSRFFVLANNHARPNFWVVVVESFKKSFFYRITGVPFGEHLYSFEL